MSPAWPGPELPTPSASTNSTPSTSTSSSTTPSSASSPNSSASSIPKLFSAASAIQPAIAPNALNSLLIGTLGRRTSPPPGQSLPLSTAPPLPPLESQPAAQLAAAAASPVTQNGLFPCSARTGSNGRMLHLVTRASPAPSPGNSQSSASESEHGIAAPSEWKSWIKGYAAGQFDPLHQIRRPASIAEEPTTPPSNTDDDQFTVFTTKETVDRSSEGALLDFYLKKGYLPGPVGQFEEARLRTMRRYGLHETVRKEAINRICSLAKAYFKTDVVIITLLFNDKQVLAAETGWVEVDPTLDDPLTVVDLNPSLCTHAMLRTQPEADEVFLVPDASKDWRFKENPQTLKHGGGLAFYAAASIHLPTGGPPAPGEVPPAADEPDLPETLPVGSICLVDHRPRNDDGFSAEDRQVLNTLAKQVSHEFQLGRESERRATEKAQAQFLSAYVNNALIDEDPTKLFAAPSTVAAFLERTKHRSHIARPSPTPVVTPETTASVSTETITSSQPSSSSSIPAPIPQFQVPTESLCALTGASAAVILDVRAYRCPMPPAPLARTANGGIPTSPVAERRPQVAKTVINGGSSNGSQLGKIYLMGEAGSVDWSGLLKDQHAKVGATVIDGLRASYDGALAEGSTESGLHSPWADLLGEHGQATSVTPIFDVDGSPALMIVLSSDLAEFQFDVADRNFIEGVGAISLGALVRQRAVQADQAKLSFVSQISHELRTPIHGVVSQVELIREFSTPAQLQTLSPFLDVADICLESLRDVLDDVLDLGKLANQSSVDAKTAYKRALVKGDLAQLAEDVTKATWVRKRRTDLVSVDAITGEPHASPGKVDVILEVQDRMGGWTAWLDTGGMRRVLLNVLGNALKFTQKGHVKLTLREAPAPEGRLPSARRKIQLIVSDTGKGMSENFLREGKLFTPFVQEDSFANGAGLGMSISLAIVERMGGKMEVTSALGEGTTMKITLPLEFCALTPGVVHPHIHNYHSTSSPVPSRKGSLSREGISYTSRTISDELGALFDPGVGKFVTPFVEKDGFDFGQAVSAAHDSLSGVRLSRIPSVKRKVSRARMREMPTTPTAEESELADEVAKLSMSEAMMGSPSALTPRFRPSRGATGDGSYFQLPTAKKGTASSLPTPTQESIALANASSPTQLPPPSASTPASATPTGPPPFFSAFAPPQPGPPVQPKPKPRPPPPSVPPAQPGPASIAPDVKVLVADDNPLARNILTKLLSGKRVAFVQAADGREAVDRFAEGNGSFNLALLDVQMPRMDGIEASFEMRKIEEERGWPRTRIVALTGLSTEQDMAKAGVMPGHSGPCDGWLVKGGKSLRTVMTEVTNLQAVLEAERAGSSGTPSPESTPEGSPMMGQK